MSTAPPTTKGSLTELEGWRPGTDVGTKMTPVRWIVSIPAISVLSRNRVPMSDEPGDRDGRRARVPGNYRVKLNLVE
jgi:hypothetical protein